MADAALKALLAGLGGRLEEFHDKVGPVVTVFEDMRDAEGDDIVEYLRVKQQLLLSYVTNLVFYVQLKLKGESCSNHPVMNSLMELRYAMEKMRPLDGKLKYQIDRLVKLAGMGEQEQTSSTLRPNPMALLAKEGGDGEQESSENESEDGDSDDGRGKEGTLIAGGDGIYRPPRMESARFDDAEAKAERQEERLKQKRKKIKNSEIFDALREEFTSAPEASTSTGMSSMSGLEKKLKADAQERTDFEEDRFVRMTMTKKEKQAIKRKEREISQNNLLGGFGANVDDLDDLAESFRDVSEMAGASSGRGKKGGVGIGGRGDFFDSDDDDVQGLGRPKGKNRMKAATAAAGSEDAMTRAARMFSQSGVDHFESSDVPTKKKRKKQ